ncbi:putative enzyme related to lactoylglutathione lyase [Naumannella cuiyingiana]|uniref:Putative enzyme related to lactoylglutathione lyase n=1 Tax=Naumannella cuiyingiana TaxID=1347891 RepID=A0A7Z0DAF1_9ACTN|nr:VOC family protein [Naumannella cuiyingiana]NYI71739.1 putative enzyme related to lactoylglutathione lyase [Naumannella cuiyingiana]
MNTESGASADLIAFTIDCSDSSRLARFYADLAGGEVSGEYPEYGYAQASVGPYTLNFQGVESYAAPAWPGQEHPQQFHLDFRVDDVAAATERATGLGASVAAEQPGGEAYRVMLDPDGHPFCLCPPAQES